MFTTLTRPYKECAAEETVARIRKILHRRDLLPAEIGQANPFPEVFSVTVSLDAARGAFQAHGKGRTAEYSRASAYAEFIERLQNGLYANYSRTLLEQLRGEFGFFYAPDERFLSRAEFLGLPEVILSDLIRWSGRTREEFVSGYFGRISDHREPGVVAVPFVCSKGGSETFLPLNLLLMAVGSNGMASGNTLNEAVFQALCELMERWAAAEVFYRQLTPPTVPDRFLRQFEREYELIRTIESTTKYEVLVKDFSAGKRIPAIGLIIRDVRNGTYRLNVGCETCFQVALSRCLTEIFQGIPNEQAFDACMLKIPKEDLACFVDDDDAAMRAREAIFGQFTRDNTGMFPQSLFGAEPDYAFAPDVFHSGSSFAEEIDRLIGFFHSEGRSVYLRTVSYLGFPSVFIYIPEVSTMGRKNAPLSGLETTFAMIEWDRVEAQVCRLSALSEAEAEQLANALQRLPSEASITGLLNVKLKPTSIWSQVPLSFVLTLLWYRAGRFSQAREAFRSFLESRQDSNEYYLAVDKYLALLEGGGSESVREVIEAAFPRDGIGHQVCDDLQDPAHVFGQVRLPACPDCDVCSLRTDCLTRALLGVSRTLYPAMQGYSVERAFSDNI